MHSVILCFQPAHARRLQHSTLQSDRPSSLHFCASCQRSPRRLQSAPRPVCHSSPAVFPLFPTDCGQLSTTTHTVNYNRSKIVHLGTRLPRPSIHAISLLPALRLPHHHRPHTHGLSAPDSLPQWLVSEQEALSLAQSVWQTHLRRRCHSPRRRTIDLDWSSLKSRVRSASCATWCRCNSD